MGHAHSKGNAGAGDSLQNLCGERSTRSFRGFMRSKVPGARDIDSPQGSSTSLVSSDGQIDKSDARSVRLTGSEPGSDRVAQLATRPGHSRSSSPIRLTHAHMYFDAQESDESDAVFDRSPATVAESAQKVGESNLIKRENQLNPILDSIYDAKDSSGSPHIDMSVLDDMILRLLDAGYSTKVTKNVCLKNAEISVICSASRELLLSQPPLLELSGPYTDLIRLFEMCGFPPASNYLFLGDYVNRGKQSLETILLLLCYKIKYPENFFLLRGNHECASITRVYGFYDECKRRCNLKIWKTFIDTFNCLPIASIVVGKIFCVHGGLSPSLSHMDDIRSIARPTDIPDYGLLNDLLWSDPADMEEDWEPNERGVSYCFGKKIIMDFLQRHDFDLICRAHMVVEDGYEFYQDRTLVTVFSAPNYCGEFDNWGAVMSVSGELLCSFELLKPLDSTALKNHFKKGRNKRNRLSSSLVYQCDQSDQRLPIMNDNKNDELESSFKHRLGKEAPSNKIPKAKTSDAILSSKSPVAIDTRRSLPEPADNSVFVLASDLFKAILSLFTSIAQRSAQMKHSRRLRSELERFFLWGDALSISNGQLDEVLSKSSDLCQTVLSTLYELGSIINDSLLRAVSELIQLTKSEGSVESDLADLTQSDMARQLQKILEKAAPVLVTPKDTANFERLSDDESMRYDLDEVLEDIAIFVDCLMDLSLALESPGERH
ncbi:uncharacterized protein N7484_004774 [Penicillium longicatenatum]|uniref:uncharacterized protein n=1 Tax=Penicillium longicatenatum TaxID=1561947 RepID=UPI00254675E1|nr:uncharacterized protein N7484_004774 [Penicillium longicatenatum]KAJ5651051.1 hypothetical protein N7484_004774 [Penicillium longicatenatum]